MKKRSEVKLELRAREAFLANLLDMEMRYENDDVMLETIQYYVDQVHEDIALISELYGEYPGEDE